MLSVATEAAFRNSQAAVQSRAGLNQTAPTTEFSALVDSNTEAASEDNAPTADRAPPATNDSTSSASEPHTNGKVPSSQAAAKPAEGTTNRGGTAATSTEPANQTQAQTTVTASTGDAVTPTTAPAAVIVKVVLQGNQPQVGTKDAKDAKSGDGAIDASAGVVGAQPAQTGQPVAVVIAVAAELSTGPQTATASAGVVTTPVTSTAPVAGAPGAIAAAAASKVAADVAATEPDPTSIVGGTTTPALSGDGQDKAAAQIQLLADQQVVTQPAAPTTSTPAAPATNDQNNGLVQAEILARPAAALTSIAPQAPAPKTTKTGVTTVITADAKLAASNPAPGAPPDVQTAAPVTNADGRASADTQTPKKPGAPQNRDSDVTTNTKVTADTAPTPTVHQHPTTAAPVEARILQSGLAAPGALDTSASSQVQLNPTTLTTQNTTDTAPLNLANLTVMTGQAAPLGGLAVEISANARAGNSRFEIRLDPPDLGRIDVRLDVDKNGLVTSRLFVEKSETLDLLRRDAPQLQQALQDAGLKTSDSGLQFSLRDQTAQGRSDGNDNNGQNPQRLVITEDDQVSAGTAGITYSRSFSATGGVDIRV